MIIKKFQEKKNKNVAIQTFIFFGKLISTVIHMVLVFYRMSPHYLAEIYNKIILYEKEQYAIYIWKKTL